MVLSDKENLPPSKPQVGLPTNYTQTQREWTTVVRGSKKTSSYAESPTAMKDGLTLPSSPASIAPSSNLLNPIQKPFLKGTVQGSVFVEITGVQDKKIFLKELKDVCEDNTHLWSIEDSIRRDYGKMYAEVTFSPTFISRVCEEGLKLPSYESKFYGYRSLSPDSEVLTITFNGLPRQYGRKDGGLRQLQEDMLANLLRFDTVCDSGTISGTTGVFSGRGYAVLELHESSVPSLSHEFHWQFSPFDVNNMYDQNCTCESLVYATWRSMPPYCRYCHSPAHAIADCPVKLRSIICYNCNRHGHMSRGCPRKNTHSNSGNSHKKARKTPAFHVLVRDSVLAEPTLGSSGVHSDAPNTSYTTHATDISDAVSTQSEVIVNPAVTSIHSADSPVASKYQSGTSASRYAPRTTRSQTAEPRKSGPSDTINNKAASVPSAPVCASCHQLGHKTKRYSKYPFNPVNLANSNQPATFSSEDGTMEIDTDDSPNSITEGPLLNDSIQSEGVPDEQMGDLDHPPLQ